MKPFILYIVLAAGIYACVATAALGENDVEYVRMLRRQRFWEVADNEIDRLLANPQVSEDTQVGLLLEKARVAKDHAMYVFDYEEQSAFIEKSRTILSKFLAKHSSRPERLEAEFEMHFLGRLLGGIYAARASLEAETDASASLSVRARSAFADALAGYDGLSDTFVKRADELSGNLETARKEYDGLPSRTSEAARNLSERINDLERKITGANEYIVFCRYLAANCLYRQGAALAESDGLTARTKKTLNAAIARFDKFFKEYKNTPYIQTAYDALFETAECMRLLKKYERVLDRIIGETTSLLIEHRERIDERPIRRSLYKLRLAQARLFNDLGRYNEAIQQTSLVIAGGAGGDSPEGARLEYGRALFLKGEKEEGVKRTSKIADNAGPYQLEAKQLLSRWLRDDPDLVKSLSFSAQFDIASRAYNSHDFEFALKIYGDIENNTSGADELKWDPRCLVQTAYCHYNIGANRHAALESQDKKSEARETLKKALAQAVHVLWDKLSVRFGQTQDPAAARIVRNSFHLALKWQNDLVRLDRSEENTGRLRIILEAFNRHFPDSPGTPDVNYLDAVCLERDREYVQAIELYDKVSAAKNQSYLAIIRRAVCRYHIYCSSPEPDLKTLLTAGNGLMEGAGKIARVLRITGEGELESFEKDDFRAALAEAAYYQAAIIFSAGGQHLEFVLPEGETRNCAVIRILSGFDARYTLSPFSAAANFLRGASLLLDGRADEVEEILAVLEKKDIGLYRDLLLRLREYYYDKYAGAARSGDSETSTRYGTRYINSAERFYAAFEGSMNLSDYIRMADYYYDNGRFSRAGPLLEVSLEGLGKILQKGGFDSVDEKRVVEDSLTAVRDRLAYCLVEKETARARKLYAQLEEDRRRRLRTQFTSTADYQKALRNDSMLLKYVTFRAICDIRIEKEKNAGLPDFDILIDCVNVLAGAVRRHQPKTGPWWRIQYWLVYGMYLQRDSESSLRYIANLSSSTGDFSEDSGALQTGPEGKTYRRLFAELKEKIIAK